MHIGELAQSMLCDSVLWGGDSLPFTGYPYVGHPQVLLVVGENCSGKSFFVESLRAWSAHHHGMASICVSIRERTGSGLSDMSGLRRSMMFGDECEQSTGACSARVVETAFSNVHSWAEAGRKPVLVLDEPEIGLSDGYARAMGQYLGQQAKTIPPGACGVVIVTHSRTLAGALRDELGVTPSFVRLEAVQDFDAWVVSVEHRSVEELLTLRELNHERWRQVSKALSSK